MLVIKELNGFDFKRHPSLGWIIEKIKERYNKCFNLYLHLSILLLNF
jgi:hypothetical protein